MDDYTIETLEQAAGIGAIGGAMADYFLEKEEARELFYQWMTDKDGQQSNATRDDLKGGLEIARSAFDRMSLRAANRIIAKRLSGILRWSPN